MKTLIFKFLLFFALTFECAVPATATPPPIGSTQSSVPEGISFVAGTLVATEDGKKPIEKLNVGDLVWATDQHTRKSGYHKVTHIFVQDADETIDLLTSSRENITSASSSLFWVNTKGWVKARSLFPGEQLLQRDGTFTKVFNVIPKHAPETKVYSFEVEDFHTYYVGEKGILVHNNCMALDLLRQNP